MIHSDYADLWIKWWPECTHWFCFCSFFSLITCLAQMVSPLWVSHYFCILICHTGFQSSKMHTCILIFLTFVSCLIPHAHYRDITWFNLEQFLCIAVWCGDFYSSEAITIDVLVKMFNFRTVKKYFNFLNLFTSLLLKAVKGVTFSLNNSAVIMTIILNPWQFWPYLPARYHLCYFESLN